MDRMFQPKLKMNKDKMKKLKLNIKSFWKIKDKKMHRKNSLKRLTSSLQLIKFQMIKKLNL